MIANDQAVDAEEEEDEEGDGVIARLGGDRDELPFR